MKFLILACTLAVTVVANDIIDGEYMVRLVPEYVDTDVKEAAFTDVLKTVGVDVQKYYHMNSLVLMHVKADQKSIERLQSMTEVTYVEPNQLFYTTQACAVESHPGVWGLDRIDQTGALSYTDPADVNAVYNHGENTGAGTTAYVVDTGIRITHNEFGGRAVWGHSAGILPETDDNGHGTHCAGTIGSNAYGVAKGTALVACKCLNSNGSGSTDNVVECIDWSAADCAGGKCSMNLSLGGGASVTMDDAVAAAVTAGVSVVCAAGNSDADACNSSPGREPSAITVGASEVDDQSATYTNWGTCVDVFAPGTSILSCWIRSDTDTNIISGTSMACPHVVGVVARYQSNIGIPTPAAIHTYIVGSATTNAISFRVGHDSSPNLLLFRDCP